MTVIDSDAGDTHLLTVSDDRFDIAEGALKLKSGKALDFEAEAFIGLEITAVDSGSPPLSLASSFELTVRDVEEPLYPWQNETLQRDVDDNGRATHWRAGPGGKRA